MSVAERGKTERKRRIKWGIVTRYGKYVADPSGRTDSMAWTYDREAAQMKADLFDGKVVDVEKFVKEFNAKGR